MADITKKVDRGMPVNGRYQVFTQADVSATDVILVKESLGKSAKSVTIESAGGMTFRLNVYRTVYPRRLKSSGFPADGFGDNVSMGVQYKDSSATVITLAASETIQISSNIMVDDIEIVTVTGNFEIICS